VVEGAFLLTLDNIVEAHDVFRLDDVGLEQPGRKLARYGPRLGEFGVHENAAGQVDEPKDIRQRGYTLFRPTAAHRSKDSAERSFYRGRNPLQRRNPGDSRDPPGAAMAAGSARLS
jgi:hypothetical protein